MKDHIQLEINADNVENLNNFSQILNKDVSQILNEALEEYFVNEQKKLLEKSIEDDSALTNLDYDEFWDGVDLE